MSKKLNAVIPDETWEELEQIAKGEMRTKSQMAAILLAEAIAVRRGTTQKSSEDDRTPPPPSNGEASQPEPPKQGQRQPTKRGKGKEG